MDEVLNLCNDMDVFYTNKEWIEKNLTWVVCVIILVILVPFVIKRIKKLRRELRSL